MVWTWGGACAGPAFSPGGGTRTASAAGDAAVNATSAPASVAILHTPYMLCTARPARGWWLADRVPGLSARSGRGRGRASLAKSGARPGIRVRGTCGAGPRSCLAMASGEIVEVAPCDPGWGPGIQEVVTVARTPHTNASPAGGASQWGQPREPGLLEAAGLDPYSGGSRPSRWPIVPWHRERLSGADRLLSAAPPPGFAATA